MGDSQKNAGPSFEVADFELCVEGADGARDEDADYTTSAWRMRCGNVCLPEVDEGIAIVRVE